MRVAIRTPSQSDEEEFLGQVRRNRKFHRLWVHPPSSPEAFEGYLKRISNPSHESYVIHERGKNGLVGVVNLNEIVYGSFCSAYLGYYVFEEYSQQRLMSDGMVFVIRFAFRRHKLHRLEANIQPENHASIALVHRLGFERKGFSPCYLKVSGRWRDHERWALLADRSKPSLSASVSFEK